MSEADAWQLCRVMLKYKKEIVGLLKAEERLEDFNGQINSWRKQHLCSGAFQMEPATRGLQGIIQEFKLVDLLEESIGVTARTRGAVAVKTRGAKPPSRTLKDIMQEVAQQFRE